MKRLLLLLTTLVTLTYPAQADIVISFEANIPYLSSDFVVIEGVRYEFELGDCLTDFLSGASEPSSITILGGSFKAVSYDDNLATDVHLLSELSLEQAGIRCSTAAKIKYSLDDNPLEEQDKTFPVVEYAKGMFKEKTKLRSISLPTTFTVIEREAFEKCTSLTTVNLPATICFICEYAFWDCSSLSSINIPDGVTSIGHDAFGFCHSLTSINIPKGVTSIDRSAFESCSSLTSIKISDGVTSIGMSAFGGCSNLTSITVDRNNPKYDSRNDCNAIIETATNTLIAGCVNTVIPNDICSIADHAFINIPDGVTSIGSGAFYGCSSLISINIPDEVTSIGEEAFSYCSSLISINIPDGVTSIGNQAFYGCSSLTSINIPDGVTSIGELAFSDCSSLTSINIPDGVTIGGGAFWGCSTLTSITIPDGVTSIGEWTFCGCSSLTSINIPEGVTTIGEYLFYCCSSLSSINIPDGVTSIGYAAFEACNKLHDVYCYAEEVPTMGFGVFGDTNLSDATLHVPASAIEAYRNADQWKDFGTIVAIEDDNLPIDFGYVIISDDEVAIYALEGNEYEGEVVIPGTISVRGKTYKVVDIRDSAFSGCSKITSITIPDGVTSIGNQAFYGCSSLTSINIPDGVTSIGESAFSDCSSLTSISIPNGITSISWFAYQHSRWSHEHW